MTRTAKADNNDPSHETEHWTATTADGDRLDLALAWVRGDIVAGHADQQTRSSLHPEFYRTYKIDSFSDVVRSQSAGTDHASEAKVGFAGHIADYLGPADALVAIVSVPAFHREIWLPDRP